jgi:hypothetical protein
MKGQTRGIVIALASAAAGGLLPAAVAEQMIGTYHIAAGLGAVALMNAAIAMVHIGMPVDTDRARNDAHQGTNRNSAALTSSNVEIKVAASSDNVPPTQTKSPKEPLNFPVLGWYAPTPMDGDDLPMDAVMKKPAKSRA